MSNEYEGDSDEENRKDEERGEIERRRVLPEDQRLKEGSETQRAAKILAKILAQRCFLPGLSRQSPPLPPMGFISYFTL
jgi:hypothetical protein